MDTFSNWMDWMKIYFPNHKKNRLSVHCFVTDSLPQFQSYGVETLHTSSTHVGAGLRPPRLSAAMRYFRCQQNHWRKHFSRSWQKSKVLGASDPTSEAIRGQNGDCTHFEIWSLFHEAEGVPPEAFQKSLKATHCEYSIFLWPENDQIISAHLFLLGLTFGKEEHEWPTCVKAILWMTESFLQV